MRKNCVIIDDERLAREKIKYYLTKVDGLVLTGEYATAESFLHKCSNESNLLLFVDINLPDLNGLELARMVHGKNQVIFTTAYSEFALEGFDLDAIDYMLKPFDFNRFYQGILKAERQMQSAEYLLIKEGKKTHRVLPEEVYYIEGLKEYVIWHTVNGKIIEHSTLKKSLKRLESMGFYQIHKSFIVQIKFVSAFESTNVTINNQNLPIGRSFKTVLDVLARS